jgi:CRP-like cAMP-binding protein
MKTVRIKTEEIIFNQGDRADRLYLIKQGIVGLTTQIDLTTYRRTPIVSKVF